MEAADKKKLLYDRVRLIRAMQEFNDRPHYSMSLKASVAIDNAIHKIRQDVDSFLSYSQEEDGYISYADKPQHKFDGEKRYRTKLGRYLRRNLEVSEEHVSDAVIEKMNYKVMGILSDNGNNKITVISGNAIMDAYEREYGNESCMTGSNAEFTKLYAINPDKVSMVVFKNGYARALLWTCDDGIVVLDRIYPNSGSHVEIMVKWATEQGYVHRREHGGGYNRLSDDKHHQVTLKKDKYYPYMDTFKFGDIDGDTILVSTDHMFGTAILECTDGYIEDDNAVTCRNCNDMIHEDDIHESNGGYTYCESCYDDLFTECGNCGGEVYRDNAYDDANGDTLCEGCYHNLCATCEYCDKVVSRDDVFESDGVILCEDCYSDEVEEEPEAEQMPLPITIDAGTYSDHTITYTGGILVDEQA